VNVRLIFVLLWLPLVSFAQGFAGLGSSSEGFELPETNPMFQFPFDDGSHPDFKVEWWYLTANLQGDDGRDYGLQWTLFRTALSPKDYEGWSSPQLWMGHAAVTTPDAHFVTERLSRGGIGQAGVVIDPFEAWIDEWMFSGPDSNAVLRAAGLNFAYEMALSATGPRVLHGAGGYSVKSADGHASYYFSQPFFKIEGTLRLPLGDVAVTGDAWLDHEWSSKPLGANQTGWDWFSLSFDDGSKLMGFLLRGDSVFSQATLIGEDGTPVAYPDGAFSAKPIKQSQVAGRDVPTTWRVMLPDAGIDIVVTALNTQSWMDTSVPYWEGPVRVTGSHTGRGYLEMTGYE
ncbi:MAG: lipocalin-like domain-containing protein, partial [Planktomarina sp.]|nr:lipocalin-like domain-containing protein [Planktomarina sp.]